MVLQADSSASSRITARVSVGATGTARTSFFGLRGRVARSAALVVAPVAMRRR